MLGTRLLKLYTSYPQIESGRPEMVERVSNERDPGEKQESLQYVGGVATARRLGERGELLDNVRDADVQNRRGDHRDSEDEQECRYNELENRDYKVEK